MDPSLLLAALGVTATVVIGGWQIVIAMRKSVEAPYRQGKGRALDLPSVIVEAPNCETVKLILLLASTGQKFPVEIPCDMVISGVIPLLARELGISPATVRGMPIGLHLFVRDSGTRLDDASTLRQNGLVPGQTISLEFDRLAG